MKNKTWKLVDKPKNVKALDLKWVFTNKLDGRKKARLVVRGYQQDEQMDDIYSPVARMQTLKLLLAHCNQQKYIINQMDVETAFLNGKVKSEVYVEQPIKYNKSDKVLKLEKALYGLRESPRAWYECLNEYLKSLKFQKSKTDYCLYFKDENDERIFILLFVDDILICSKSQSKIDQIKKRLSSKFSMKDLGKIKINLGINIDYNCKRGKLSLGQTEYIQSLANVYNLKNSKLHDTPMEQYLHIPPAQSESTEIKYRNLIGALLYISTCTRPDISYSVNYLSRFQNCYNKTHFNYALRVLKYLYLTKNLKLTYQRNVKNDILDCYVDGDWAGDKNNKQSTTGFFIRHYGNVIFHHRQEQNTLHCLML